jgi:hypothetical protein
VDRLTLARGCAGGTVRQEVVAAERFGVGVVGVQRVHQRRPFLDDPNTRVAVAVDPAFGLSDTHVPHQRRMGWSAIPWARSRVSEFAQVLGEIQGV